MAEVHQRQYLHRTVRQRFVNQRVFAGIFELGYDRAQTLTGPFAAVLVADVFEHLAEERVVEDVVENVRFVVQRDPGFEAKENALLIYVIQLKSLTAPQIQSLQHRQLLSDQSLPSCLPLQLVHHEPTAVDLLSDVLQRFEVNVVQTGVFGDVGDEWREEGVEAAGLEDEEVEVGVGESKGDVGVCSVRAVLSELMGTRRLKPI